MNYSIGQIVYSKQGHDKDDYFIIEKEEGEFIYLVNGKTRLLDNPKKKKKKHVQIVNYVDNDIKEKFEQILRITNADIRDAIEKYKNMNAKGD